MDKQILILKTVRLSDQSCTVTTSNKLFTILGDRHLLNRNIVFLDENWNIYLYAQALERHYFRNIFQRSKMLLKYKHFFAKFWRSMNTRFIVYFKDYYLWEWSYYENISLRRCAKKTLFLCSLNQWRAYATLWFYTLRLTMKTKGLSTRRS